MDNVTLTATMDIGLTAAINNHGEVAFAARYKGQSTGGVFFQGQDGKLTMIAGAKLKTATGKTLTGANWPTLNDAGQVGFLAAVSGLNNTSTLAADHGAINPVALVGDNVTGIGKIVDTNGTWVNNQNGNALAFVTFKSGAGPFCLVLRTSTGLVPVVTPGMAMPGGGTFRAITMSPGGPGYFTISDANDLGQHAFLASIVEDGLNETGAYRMDADGHLSLIAKTGSLTSLGVIDQLGIQADASFGISLNSKGQVALPLHIRGLPSMVALLTPNAGTP